MPSRFVKTSIGKKEDVAVAVGTDPITGRLALYFYERRNGKTYAAKPVELVFAEVGESSPFPPTLQMDYFYAEPFLEALAEALDKAGVKTEHDATIQGQLDATRYHLEDLRTLLKLKK